MNEPPRSASERPLRFEEILRGERVPDDFFYDNTLIACLPHVGFVTALLSMGLEIDARELDLDLEQQSELTLPAFQLSNADFAIYVSTFASGSYVVRALEKRFPHFRFRTHLSFSCISGKQGSDGYRDFLQRSLRFRDDAAVQSVVYFPEMIPDNHVKIIAYNF